MLTRPPLITVSDTTFGFVINFISRFCLHAKKITGVAGIVDREFRERTPCDILEGDLALEVVFIFTSLQKQLRRFCDF